MQLHTSIMKITAENQNSAGPCRSKDFRCTFFPFSLTKPQTLKTRNTHGAELCSNKLIPNNTMYRTVLSRLRPLKGRAGNLGVNRYATLSAVASRSSSPGLFSWLTGEHASLPPLDVPLEGISAPPSIPDYVEPSKLKSKVLDNGARVASVTSPIPSASIGLYVNCGSMYETPLTCGATYLLERMAFKSTRNRSHLRLVREVEAIGGNVLSSASREQIGYTIDALKTYMPEMVEILIDSVRNPSFLDWEVKEEVAKAKAELKQLSSNYEGLLLEAIHSAAYSGALANPLLAPEAALDRLDSTILEEFVAEHYTAPRMVLAASGVEFEELISVAEPLLSDLPRVPLLEEPKSVYVGGDYRRVADSEMTHVAVAFEVPGGWHDVSGAVVLTVLQMLMGGGGSFSAGGPGKGMHSMLYRRILNRYPEVIQFSAFNSMLNNTGLFGIYASTGSDFIPKVVELAVMELFAVADGAASIDDLNRAKEATKSAILMNLESRMVLTEDIGRQFLTYGERKSVDQFLKIVDEITRDDISNLVQKMISSPITMASVGDVVRVPSYEAVSNMLRTS